MPAKRRTPEERRKATRRKTATLKPSKGTKRGTATLKPKTGVYLRTGSTKNGAYLRTGSTRKTAASKTAAKNAPKRGVLQIAPGVKKTAGKQKAKSKRPLPERALRAMSPVVDKALSALAQPKGVAKRQGYGPLKAAPKNPKMVSGQKVDEKEAARVERLKKIARANRARKAQDKKTPIKKPAASMSKTSTSAASRSVKKTQLARTKGKTSYTLNTPSSPKHIRKKTSRRRA
jgi:hypothetical protein